MQKTPFRWCGVSFKKQKQHTNARQSTYFPKKHPLIFAWSNSQSCFASAGELKAQVARSLGVSFAESALCLVRRLGGLAAVAGFGRIYGCVFEAE